MMVPVRIKLVMAGCFLLSICITGLAEGQLQRERVQEDALVEDVFWAPQNVGLSTVQNLSAKSINTTIVHTFGLVRGGVDRFFGMDDGANTRIGVDYGFTDRFSAGLGRMTFNKIVDIRGKYNILRQTESGSTPFELAVKASAGINTTSGAGLEFSERLSYYSAVMLARKFNRLSLQASPVFAHFNRVIGDNPHQLFGLGLLFNYELNDRFALSGEYLPIIGKRNQFSEDAAAIALNIYTGGHVFQLFFTSSQWHNEQFIMANNRDSFWDGDLRFGFNIHRVFGLSRN
jgi:hypothetical protein